MRKAPHSADQPLAIVDQVGNAQVISSLNVPAQIAGCHMGQPLRDAHAMCHGLITRARAPLAEAHFRTVLRRWAGKFSPWVSEEGETGLVADLSGCAHLFGGEAALMQAVQHDCDDMGLSVCMGLADTRGAAWALARFADQEASLARSGDAISQEARATRARAAKRRHWTKGGTAPHRAVKSGANLRIAPPGQAWSVLGPLPIAALRLEPDMVAQLNRLGLRRIQDLTGQPRAALARRFGKGLVMRLDQAMGSAPEPISPAKPPDHFAVRLTLPEPIGLKDDIMAGIDRLLPPLCTKLETKQKAIRSLRLEAYRTDHRVEHIDVTLAKPSVDPTRIRPLLELKIDNIDAGFGVDMLRLNVLQSEPVQKAKTVGHLEASHSVAKRLQNANEVDDLIGRLGARVGMDAITRVHPASSNIPEKTSQTLAAAWSRPAEGPWPHTTSPRPLMLWRPEIVQAPDQPYLPAKFRWRAQTFTLVRAAGPERIAPEWWLDDADWRTGTRDYWHVTVDSGEQLWLYFAHGAALSPGWFCHGRFS
jgi:protein ImuB